MSLDEFWWDRIGEYKHAYHSPPCSILYSIPHCSEQKVFELLSPPISSPQFLQILPLFIMFNMTGDIITSFLCKFKRKFGTWIIHLILVTRLIAMSRQELLLSKNWVFLKFYWITENSLHRLARNSLIEMMADVLKVLSCSTMDGRIIMILEYRKNYRSPSLH